MARMRRIECPICDKNISVRQDGTITPHVKGTWEDICPGSGRKVAENLLPIN